MLGNGYYLVSNNGKYGMMGVDDKEIVPLKYDYVSPFRSHTALLYNNNTLIGYISDKGRVKEFPVGKYQVTPNAAFYDGYLRVKNSEGYFYLRASDDKVIGPLSGGMPFTEGYAVIKVPENMKHVLDGEYIFQVLSAKTGEQVKLKLGEYDEEDIDFISGVCNGRSIIVLKKRFYEYDFRNETLTPIHTDGNPENKKSRVMADERPVKMTTTQEGFVITFKKGQMNFDPMMRLTSIAYVGQNKKLMSIPEEVVEEKKSNIQCLAYPNTKLFGLGYNGKEILTPQFEKVISPWNDEAMVMVNGKYGVLTVDPNQTCHFVLNDNMPIGFEHKTAVTSVKAVCPPSMKSTLMTLNSEDENCQIKIDTRKENTNIETTVLSYQCVLNIPEEISLDKSSANTKFALNYDGLKLVPNTIPYSAWYINNYTVQILKHTIDGSTLTAEILVNNNVQGSQNFFRNVTIDAQDSVICNLTKITEELYSARFYGWKNGTLRFSIDITEDGCPTISYDRSIAVSTGKKAGKGAKTVQSEAPEAPVVEQPKIKRKASKPKREEKKIITHF